MDNPSDFDFEQIARLHGTDLARRALRLTRDRDQACDLVQTTFERALRSVRRPAPELALRWLGKIMQHAFIDDRRKRRSRSRYLEVRAVVDDFPAAEGGAEPVSAWRLVDDDDLARCVGGLPPAMRQVYTLQLSGLPHAEFAKRLGVERSTIGTRILRMRRKLRTMLLPH
jgi:RNA polymerase sigma-70 factor (ECF subfamily)